MRTLVVTGCILLGTLFLALLGGCQTESTAGPKSLGPYCDVVSGTSDRVTAAAEKAAADLHLSDVMVVANVANVAGKITARTASGDNITIGIHQASDNVSTFTIFIDDGSEDSVNMQLRLAERIRYLLS